MRPHAAGANRAVGLSDKLFALGDSVIITALHRIALMPVFVLSARICPEVIQTLYRAHTGVRAVGEHLPRGDPNHLQASTRHVLKTHMIGILFANMM